MMKAYKYCTYGFFYAFDKKVRIVEVESQMDEFEKIYFNGDFFNRKNIKLYILCLCKGVVQKDIVIWGLATMLPDGQKYLKLMLDN